MNDYPEHDPELVTNKRAALRFLHLLAPDPDHFDTPQLLREDARPLLRSSHRFVTKDDVVGRADPALSKTLTGPLDAHWKALDSLNRTRRAGIFVVLDASRCILANFAGTPTRAFPCDPSFSISCGWSADITRRPLLQYGWLTTGDMPAVDRADIAAQLRVLGASSVVTGGECFVRVPGFHTRSGRPALVNFAASNEAQDSAMTFYDPAELLRGFGVERHSSGSEAAERQTGTAGFLGAAAEMGEL